MKRRQGVGTTALLLVPVAVTGLIVLASDPAMHLTRHGASPHRAQTSHAQPVSAHPPRSPAGAAVVPRAARGAAGRRVIRNAARPGHQGAPPPAVTSADAATEHAFAVASPSVVYIDNAGVGSGSGVIYDPGGD